MHPQGRFAAMGTVPLPGPADRLRPRKKGEDVSERGLYERRFDPAEQAAKREVWAVLCRDFFQRYVRPDDEVLDLAAGFCEFINHIECREKFAVDLNEQVRRHAAPEVTVHVGPAGDLSWLGAESIDLVFASNFFEHLGSKEEMLAVLAEIRRVLRPRGRILVLQPNIRFAYRVYWDFFDHRLPLSDRSMVEGLQLAGFEPSEVRPRFLPYTTKSRLPSWPLLVRLYLRCPPLHRILGQQMFVAAVKV
jgi:SAM-dependent methyltransferase